MFRSDRPFNSIYLSFYLSIYLSIYYLCLKLDETESFIFQFVIRSRLSVTFPTVSFNNGNDNSNNTNTNDFDGSNNNNVSHNNNGSDKDRQTDGEKWGERDRYIYI